MEEKLFPVVVQDYETGEVRMLAYVNGEALRRTLETGYAHYYSRSRKKIWKKGETSGNYQEVVEVRKDCDGDAYLYVIKQKGVACHTGNRNCFYQRLNNGKVSPLPFEILKRLEELIKDRIKNKPKNSYTVKLVSCGESRVYQKFGEEAVELILALSRGKREEVILEGADLLYSLIVSLALRGVSITEILEELIRRFRSSSPSSEFFK